MRSGGLAKRGKWICGSLLMGEPLGVKRYYSELGTAQLIMDCINIKAPIEVRDVCYDFPAALACMLVRVC